MLARPSRPAAARQRQNPPEAELETKFCHGGRGHLRSVGRASASRVAKRPSSPWAGVAPTEGWTALLFGVAPAGEIGNRLSRERPFAPSWELGKSRCRTGRGRRERVFGGAAARARSRFRHRAYLGLARGFLSLAALPRNCADVHCRRSVFLCVEAKRPSRTPAHRRSHQSRRAESPSVAWKLRGWEGGAGMRAMTCAHGAGRREL